MATEGKPPSPPTHQPKLYKELYEGHMFFFTLHIALLLGCAVPLETIYGELFGEASDTFGECGETANTHRPPATTPENLNWSVCCAWTNCASVDWLNEANGECFPSCETGDRLLEILEKDGNLNILPEIINAYTACEETADLKQIATAGDRISGVLITSHKPTSEMFDLAVTNAPDLLKERIAVAQLEKLLTDTTPEKPDWSDLGDKKKLFQRATSLAKMAKRTNAPQNIVLGELENVKDAFKATFPDEEYTNHRQVISKTIKELREEKTALEKGW